MSLAQLTTFMKSMSTENNDLVANASGSAQKLAQSFADIKGASAQEKLEATITKVAEFAKEQGFDVTEGDVREYINGLKTQYELNPMVASMMDTYCTSSCHIGSAISAS
ncbi:hypothetical protein [Calothrix sp. CCY 0018]|uniref:hypothetical protein n=1 Tax=Calothrix sp. CCY 0018 TaxID=3103864 RepID=UPI0039C62FD0